MDVVSSVFLGLVQGLTEFAPVSSSGHLVLAHSIFGAGAEDLAFDALLHLATALAIVVYFWRDLTRIVADFLRWRAPAEGVAIIVGTIPAVLLGIFLEDLMATLFRNPLLVAGTLVGGSVIMLFAEWYARNNTANVQAEVLSVRGALGVGLFQALALVPGTSRSGMTIAGGMILGLSRTQAARFGFLLGIPILLGAGAKKFLELYSSGTLHMIGTEALVGAVVAFVSGILVIHFLLSFLRRYTLYTFIVYRLALAALIVLFVAV